MHRLISFLFVFMFVTFASINAQVFTIMNFDSAAADSLFGYSSEGPLSSIEMTDDHSDFVEGTGALDVKYVIGEYHEWGSYVSMEYRTPDSTTLDWSVSDSLSIWIKVENAPTHPEYMVFRIHIGDQPTPDAAYEEYLYENTVVFDAVATWYELKIPFVERWTDGSVTPNDSGFVRMPDGWGGSQNNGTLDMNAITGFNLSAVTTGWTAPSLLPADSVEVSFDSFTRFGVRVIPFIIFNGKAVNSNLSQFTWGQSGAVIEEGAGATPNTNAIKWTQGDEWGNGYSGFGYNIGTPWVMTGAWKVDSVKFKLKVPAGTGDLRVQFEGGGGKVGTTFTPIDDDAWHDYAIPLMGMVYQDGTSGFDTSAVNVVQMLAEGSASAGRVIYIDDWWTGTPDIDVVPPSPPTNLFVAPDNKFNLVTWTDSPGETDETYNVYYSLDPITDVSAEGVEAVDMGLGVAEGEQNISHLLFSPLGDSTVAYYYAVTAVDAAGNVSDPVVSSSPVSNTSRGIATISLTGPSGFQADGDLSEWSGMPNFRMFPSEGISIVTNTTITNDLDLSAIVYLAADADSLYLAYDITDDVIDTASANSWEQDSPDLYLGLYNWHGTPHRGYDRGAEPDYHFRFNHSQPIIDNLGGADVVGSYYWGPKFPTGYVVEAAFAWADLAALGNDDLFVPEDGMRIPFDITINDADNNPAGHREGIMAWSPNNEDRGWQSPEYWLYTWVGQRTFTGFSDIPNVVPTEYSLNQNYPNPFNPVTTIPYSIKKQGRVMLTVYNVLGQQVKTLVNEVKEAGLYSISFDASDFASGIYFYRLESNGYSKIKKLIFMK